MCLKTKVLASLQVILIFLFTFQKTGSVGRWETKHFMGMALRKHQGSFFEHELLILPSTGPKYSYGAAPSSATAYQRPKNNYYKISLIPQTRFALSAQLC